MRTILVGPGRAGMAVALAMTRAEHEIVAVVARRPDQAEAAARRLGATVCAWDRPLPSADLVLLAVRDDAITSVASRLAAVAGTVAACAHLSGLATLGAVQALAEAGLAVGSFHPLQTLPDADIGAARLAGSWAAVAASDDALREQLRDLAFSLGMTPFDVAEEARPLYHAAAAAAANVPLAALAMAEDFFEAAGVPFEAAAPLVRTVIDNAFTMGPRLALTGPVARGDEATVAAQEAAVAALVPHWLADFRAFVAALRRTAGQVGDTGDRR